MGQLITLERLREGKYSQIICYPKPNLDKIDERIKEMMSLGIDSVEFAGESRILNLPVLGKGYVGVVVLAYTKFGKVALKIRRIDADRSGMMHEAEMLKMANSANVGPKLIDFSGNFLLMEFVDGMLLPKWINKVAEMRATTRIRKVLLDILEQSWRLDNLSLDHGELSRASKHLIIDPEDKAYLLDFETASINRRVSNVTSICQYLFMRSEVAEKVKRNLNEVKAEDLMSALRTYKRDPSRERFEEILKIYRL